MINFKVIPEQDLLRGQLLYRQYEYSFDFVSMDRAEMLARSGMEGTTSLLIGTLQLEIAVESGKLLYVWGYHPHTLWEDQRLQPNPSKVGGIRALFDKAPIRGVSLSLAKVSQWSTVHDPGNGWICVVSAERNVATQLIEFATNCVAGLADNKLVSLWLRPKILHRPPTQAPTR